MNAASAEPGLDQTRDSLVSCLVLSLALHVLMVLASYAAPELLRLYPNLLPAWLHDLLAHKPPAAEMTVNLPEARPDDPKVPDPVVTLTERMIVDPTMVSDVEPDKATHEGSDNALAANPNPVSSTKPVPNIPAPEREVRGTFDNYRPAPGGSKTREHSIDSPDVVPAPPVIQPVAPPPVAVVVPDLPKPVQVEEKPAPMTRKALEPLPEPPARPPGDLALAQPTPKPVTVTPAAPPKPAPPPTPAAPAAPATPLMQLRKVAEDVYVMQHPTGSSNASFVVTPEGVLVFDLDIRTGDQVLAAIRKVTNKKVRYIIT